MAITSWYKVGEKLPTEEDIKNNKRIVVFSPCYKRDQERYRLIDAQFLTICSDVTHWTYATPPVDKK